MTQIFIFLLTSCTPAQRIDLTPTVTTSPSIPTSTPTIVLLPTATRTSLPPTSTPTQIPCDPLTADFCITDGHFVLQRPIQPPDNDSVDRTYPFASTADGTRDPHRGVEFENDFGTPVYAAADGVIVFAGADTQAMYSPWKDFYGNLIVLRHENELFTLYAHLSSIDVVTGDTVQAGDKIGEVGRSGVAVGSHLHFEIRRGDAEDYFSMVNPELWLTLRQPDFGAIALSIRDANSRFQRAAITLQQISSSNEVVAIYYLDSYHSSLALGDENAAIGDLPAGRYRVAFMYNGLLYERRVEVQSGKLTQVVIIVK
jgi:hypothetical protein